MAANILVGDDSGLLRLVGLSPCHLVIARWSLLTSSLQCTVGPQPSLGVGLPLLLFFASFVGFVAEIF